MNRSSLAAALATVVIVVLFQNCSGAFSPMSYKAQTGQSGVRLALNPQGTNGNLNPGKLDLGKSTVSNVGILAHAAYANCPQIAPKIDLYVIKNGQYEVQGRFFINSANNPFMPNKGWLQFRQALPINFPGTNVFVRVWSASADCNAYADEVGELGAYTDTYLQQGLGEDGAFPDVVKARMVNIDKANFQLKIDPNGGATYEIYSKRSHPQGGTRFNALHPHPGAAMQIAYHSGAHSSLSTQGCSGQGYYNPTQAGAICGWASGSRSAIQSPTTAVTCQNGNSDCQWAEHRMMSFDYGPGYEGPYHEIDQTYLSQKVSANEHFVEYDLKIRQNRLDVESSAFEVPTAYFSSQYRRFYYPEGNQVASVEIPANRAGLDSQRFFRTYNSGHAKWVSFENTSHGLQLSKQDAITIAWFYDAALAAAAVPNATGRGMVIQETELYHAIKFHMVESVNLRRNQVYGLRYVIFPYRYDEIIPSRFGNLSVQETIRRLASEQDGPAWAAQFRPGFISAGTPISCDYLNPDAIKNLSPETITWLGGLTPEGLTLHEHYLTARHNGYDGELGQGGHAAWMAADSSRYTSFYIAVSATANAPTPPYSSLKEHHMANRAMGYQGVFMCGGAACYLAGQCDNLGRRK